MTSTDMHWTTYFAALGPSIIAATALVIASVIQYRQWETTSNKLKMELFERRMAVWNGYQHAISLLEVNRRLSPEELIAFVESVAPARWLFSSEIDDYLRFEVFNVLERASDTHDWIEDQRRGKAGPFDKDELERRRNKTYEWMNEQREHWKKFQPYLHLGH